VKPADSIPLPSNWPPELRLLVAHLRLALGTGAPADLELARQPVDWSAWLRWVERHRVGGFLNHHLPPEKREQLPDESRRALAGSARTTARLALARAGELVRLTRLMAAAGVPCISVKGPLLARAIYGDFGQRHAGDLDLLIAPESLARADAALRAAGLRRSQPDFDLTPRQWREFQRLKHECEYFHDAAGVRVELEWQLAGLPHFDFAAEWPRAEPAALGGARVRRLRPELEFLYLFTHGAGHGWFRLFWLVDVARVLQRDDVDWPALMDAARANRAERCVWQGAWLADSLLRVPVPESLRAPAAHADRVRRLGLAARRMMSTITDEPKRVAELFRETAYQLRLRATWAGRAAVLRPRLMSPAGWKMLRLPDRWFALYYVAGPFLWLRRRARRR
jgi:hypothetical protein